MPDSTRRKTDRDITITVDKQSDGNLRFAAKGFNQEWESVASSSFHPISAALRIERRKTKKTYSMSLTYGGDRVSGLAGTTADNVTNEAKLAEMKPVSAAVPAGTIDQRIDWAAMLVSRLEIGQKSDFTVYDPATGISKVASKVTKAEQVHVPAGTFDCRLPNRKIEGNGNLRSPGQQRDAALYSSRRFLHRDVHRIGETGLSVECSGGRPHAYT